MSAAVPWKCAIAVRETDGASSQLLGFSERLLETCT
jgi:hypothetical protein